MTRLAATNAKYARDHDLAGTIAELTGLPVRTVLSRLEGAHGRTYLRTLFEDQWPNTAAHFEGRSAAWARDWELDQAPTIAAKRTNAACRVDVA